VDLGAKLGYASHMSKLERTGSAGMDLADALTLEEISSLVAENDFSFLRPIEQGIGDLPIVDLTIEQVIEARYGRFIALDSQAELLAGFHREKLVAILEKRDQVYKPRKVFLEEVLA
ncbi:TPA: tRNA pseudouridine(55) synthase TruB, partial [Streptococcus suis]|nr:tRNA pseudouridine(55) synthase TruB [Streptococcus suis]